MKLVKDRAKRLSTENVKDLFVLLDESRRAHERFIKKSERWRAMYRGRQWDSPDGTPTKDSEARIVINLVFAFIRSVIPTVFFREPTINARPTLPVHAGKEKVWEAAVNNALPRTGFKHETKKAIYDGKISGEGWEKLVWNMAPVEDAEEDDGAGSLTEGYQGSGPVTWENIELPYWARISPHNVIVDYRSNDRSLEKARVIFIEYEKDFEELKADPRYTIPKDFEPEETTRRLDSQNDFEMSAKGKLMQGRLPATVKIWEAWVYQLVGMRLYKQMVVLMDGYEEKPIRGPLTWEELVGPKLGGWPFERLVFNYSPDDYPLSDIETWIHLQQMVNWSASTIINTLKTHGDLLLFDPQKVKDPKRTKRDLREPEMVQIVEVTEPGAIERLSGTRVNPDIYNALSTLVQFVDRISGSTHNRQGGSRNIRTATEAALIDRGAQVRDDEQVDIVHDYLKAKIVKWMRSFRHVVAASGETDLVIKIAGEAGKIDWLNFGAADLDWDPEVHIDINTFRKADMQEETTRWTVVLQWAMQLMPIFGPQLVEKAFLKLVNALDVESPTELMPSTDDHKAQQMIEIVRMIMGEDVPVAPDEPHQIHMQVVEQFLAALGESLLAQNPQALQRVIEHREKHSGFLVDFQSQMASSSAGAQSGGNGAGLSTPANEARRETAREREAVKATPGSSNQFR